ncbi:MAG: MBL fold metallo-hydrolase [Calditrichia bacterium]
MKPIIQTLCIGNFEVNNYLVKCPETGETMLVDAGENPEPLLEAIRNFGGKLSYLVNTHGHGDHMGSNAAILNATNAKLLIHKLEAEYLINPQLNLSAFLGYPITSPKADRLLEEGDEIELGKLTFKVLHTPGHTPGHITLYGHGVAFVGDVIFHGSIGRTDFPGGSTQLLIESIREKIYTLPDDTVLYPGHGTTTTVAREKASNPFVNG